jgi:hypothetical protein
MIVSRIQTTNVREVVGKKGTLIPCWWECKLVQPKKSSLEAPQNDPSISLLGMYLKGCKSGYNEDTCTPMFITALFTIAKLWKQFRCRKCGIHIYTHGILFSHKEE